MPDSETDVEVPVEDAVEQEHVLAPSAAAEGVGTGSDATLLEANEADYAEQQSVVGYDDEDYR